MGSERQILWTIQSDVAVEDGEARSPSPANSMSNSYEEDEEYEEEEWTEEEITDEEMSEEEDAEFGASLTISLSPANESLTVESLPAPQPIQLPSLDRPPAGPLRQPMANALPPPPIFTASVTVEGMDSWSPEEDEEELYNVTLRLSGADSGCGGGSDVEYDGNMDVGCTLSLVDQAALRDSNDECSDESLYEDEEYTEEEITDEEEYTDEEVEEEEEEEELNETPSKIMETPKVQIDAQPQPKSDRKSPLPVEIPKAEPLKYKRSALLEPKEEIRPKRTYEIVRPVINDEFDKQMAALREQMRDHSARLQDEFKGLSRGIGHQQDEAKLRALAEQHKQRLDETAEQFGAADAERRRWTQQRDTESDRRAKEAAEKERQREEDAIMARAATMAAAESRKITVRRPKKTVDPLEPKQTDSKIPSPAASRKQSTESGIHKKNVLSAAENSPVAERRKSIPANRRKTMELMKITVDAAASANRAKKNPLRKRSHNRTHRLVRKPADVDELLGLTAFDDFDSMDQFFACEPLNPLSSEDTTKRPRLDPQKVWISQLKDIDKLYKASELRDLKLEGLS